MVSMMTKLCRMVTVTYKVTLFYIVLQDIKLKYNNFTTTIPMATRVGKMVNYLERLLSITSRDPSSKWSNKVK